MSRYKKDVRECLNATPEMLDYARGVAGDGSVVERARRLYKALLDYGLNIGYCEDLSLARRPDGSKTAAQVFYEQDGQGKRFAICLEYTLLFLALAPACGLEAVAMRKLESIGEGRGFVFGHIALAVRDGGQLRLIDLAARRFWRDPVGFEEISQDRLVGYYHNNSGIIFSLQGRSQEAEAAFSLAVACDPATATFWYNRGSLLLRGGQAQSASLDLRQAAGLDPGSVQVLTNLAVAESALGQLGEARRCLYLARTLAPDDARVAFNLGVLAYEENDRAAAEEHWRQTLAIDPVHQQARRWLADLLRCSGRQEEGLRILGGLG